MTKNDLENSKNSVIDSEAEILQDVDIMRQLEEGKTAKSRDFEDLAKELGI